MQWLRLYHDTPNDPKWRLVAVRSGQPVGNVLAVWMSMLVCASEAEQRGTLEGWDDELAAVVLGYTPAAVTSIRSAMQGLVLDGAALTGWDKRQRNGDGSAERVRQYRERLHKGTGRKSTPYVSADIIALDGGACIYCGDTEKLCVDHMVPLICGGDHEQDNLACACRRCNSGKAGRTPEQARYAIRSAAARERYMHALARLGINPHTVKPIKPGEPVAPTTVTHEDVTVTGADVTVTDKPVTKNPLTLSYLPSNPTTLIKTDDEDAGARVREIAGRVAELAALDAKKIRVGMVEAWLFAGCDPERDIFPAVQHCVKRAPEPIESFRYFDAEVRRFQAERTAPLAPVASNVTHLHRPAAGGRPIEAGAKELLDKLAAMRGAL